MQKYIKYDYLGFNLFTGGDKIQNVNNLVARKKDMLVTFSIGNFLSFKDVQTLNLEPEALKDLPNNLHIPYLYNHETRLVKSVAIYGHNSYGKTNFLKGFQFLQALIFNSFANGQTKSDIEIEPFKLNSDSLDRPTLFEITFLVKEVKYRYKLVITQKYVVQEELHYAEARVRENYLFLRDGDEIKISKVWNKEANNKIEQATFFTKSHILFLSVLISQDIPRIAEIAKWLSSNLIIPDSYLSEFSKARAIYSDASYRNLILKFIDKADIGFQTIFDKVNSYQRSTDLEKGLLNMWFDKEIKDFELYTQHKVYNDQKKEVGNVEFELQKNESSGSIKYFIIVCLISYAIKNSQVIWIDELDARFDSSLLEMLVKSYHDPEINPINSQMIFTTHNTVLLDKKLRRDQMVIVEKNEFGESSLRRMHSSKKPIRVGKSIEKDYRTGKLGGVSKKIASNLNRGLLFDDSEEK